jgi:hypothetical protein
MIVTKTLKLTTLLIAMVGILPTFAAYRIAIPLETTQGGALPTGSIVLGNVTNPDNGTPPPASTNCIYNDDNLVVVFNKENSVYKVGDELYGYNQTIIGFNIPSRGFTVPSGLSKGARKDDGSNPDAMMYEICSDNFSSYPSLPPLSGPGPEPIDPPVDDRSGPDWTPECILNTTTDYAALNTLNNSREFHSTTFGLNHVAVPNWNYVPADYDPNNPSSYIFFDKSEQSGDPRVSGPNPNFSYSEICRVRKRDL